MHPYSVAVAIMLALTACQQATEYTESEAPKRLKLDQATIRADVRFLPGSSRIAAGDAVRLGKMAASGQLAPADRVLVAASGSPDLAAARVATLSDALLQYGIVASPVVLADVPPNGAVVTAQRYLVTLPPCPNWSKPPAHDFANAVNSNFGCATVSNLGRMVASPADLASGQPLGLAVGKPAQDAVDRYRSDIDPSGKGIKPLTGAATGGGGAGAGTGP
jgi:pilus assembly protein CpaD